MLELYLDDSGHVANTHFLVSAGYIATTETWRDFTVAWKLFLRSQGLPYFRSWDCEYGQNAFAGMRRFKRASVARQATAVIRDHGLVGVSRGVVNKDFCDVMDDDTQRWFNDETPFASYRPLDHILRGCIEFVAVYWRERMPTESIVVTFSRGTYMLREAMEYCEWLSANAPWSRCVREIRSGDQLQHVALQAADLFAFETRKRAEQVAANAELVASQKDMRPQLRSLVRGQDVDMRLWNRVNLSTMIADMKAGRRQPIAPIRWDKPEVR